VSIKGKVLIFPSGKGSVGATNMLWLASRNGAGPKAIVMNEADPPVVFGAILSNIPMIREVRPNPVEA